MKRLTKQHQDSYANEKIFYICKGKFENKYQNDKEYSKVRDHCHYARKYRSAMDGICNLRYSVLKKDPIVFYNGSNYDYKFIIKRLAEDF